MYKQLMIALFGFACVGLSAQESDGAEGNAADNNGTEQTTNNDAQGQEVAADSSFDNSGSEAN